eukprot:32706-Pelagomonas_calceolata.AAC.1
MPRTRGANNVGAQEREARHASTSKYYRILMYAAEEKDRKTNKEKEVKASRGQSKAGCIAIILHGRSFDKLVGIIRSPTHSRGRGKSLFSTCENERVTLEAMRAPSGIPKGREGKGHDIVNVKGSLSVPLQWLSF